MCVDGCVFQSLVIPEKFQHILRVLNTNIDGRRKIAFAITAIKVSSPSSDSDERSGWSEVPTTITKHSCKFWMFFDFRVLADVTPMWSWGRPTLTSTRGPESWLRRRWGAVFCLSDLHVASLGNSSVDFVTAHWPASNNLASDLA